MIFIKDKVVLGMASVRFISSLIEFTAAVLFLKYDSIEKALKINAVLALIGPTIMTIVMALGLTGMSGKVSLNKFCFILAGVILIFYGAGKGR